MTTVLLLLALLKANGTQGITVHVRAVDREALALPGVEITAIEVSECRSLTETSSNVVKDTTGREGVVALTLPRAHAYVIRSGGGNGFEVAETCLPNLAGTEPRYVQLQLRFDPSNTVTH
jgi:hypothetical protein